MAQQSVLERIELLLGYTNSEKTLSDNERLEKICTKLTEYITTTKSMLHECMLTLAETVIDQLQDKEEELDDGVDHENESDYSDNYYSNPEEEDD